MLVALVVQGEGVFFCKKKKKKWKWKKKWRMGWLRREDVVVVHSVGEWEMGMQIEEDVRAIKNKNFHSIH